jgi:hypothetical protein
MIQAKLFEAASGTVDVEAVLLYALGEFQSRGHALADRELALDRLHGAFTRAAAKFGIAELSDEEIVAGLRDLGITVDEIPSFFAKRPYRVNVPEEVCRLAVHKVADQMLKHKLIKI